MAPLFAATTVQSASGTIHRCSVLFFAAHRVSSFRPHCAAVCTVWRYERDFIWCSARWNIKHPLGGAAQGITMGPLTRNCEKSCLKSAPGIELTGPRSLWNGVCYTEMLTSLFNLTTIHLFCWLELLTRRAATFLTSGTYHELGVVRRCTIDLFSPGSVCNRYLLYRGSISVEVCIFGCVI